MITCGAFVKPENRDWAHEHLIEILEMFMVRHKNFDRSQFAEDLQEHIYTETMICSNNTSKWKRDVFAKRGLDEYGVKFEKPTETENVLNLSEMSTKDLETDDLDTLASQISAVMKNPLMPDNLFNLMADELSIVPEDWRTPDLQRSTAGFTGVAFGAANDRPVPSAFIP